jgi:hypothetical protein
VTVWGSNSDEIRQLLQAADPSVPTFYSFWEVVKLLLLTISGLLPFWTLRPGVVDIPLVEEGMIAEVKAAV